MSSVGVALLMEAVDDVAFEGVTHWDDRKVCEPAKKVEQMLVVVQPWDQFGVLGDGMTAESGHVTG